MKQCKYFLIKILQMLTHSQINLCHSAVWMEHWQMVFRYPKYHFWNQFQLSIHSTNKYIKHLLCVRHYAGCCTSKMVWLSDFSRIPVSKAVLLKLFLYQSVPSFDKHEYPPPTSQQFQRTLLTLRVTDTQNIDSIFCVFFTDQISSSFYFLFQKQRT